jgi:hypothetical protein
MPDSQLWHERDVRQSVAIMVASSGQSTNAW